MELNKRNVTILVVGASALSAAVGSSVSHVLTRNHFEKKFEKLLDEEITKAKDHYAKVYKKDQYADLEALSESAKNDSESIIEIDQDIVEEIIDKMNYNTIRYNGDDSEVYNVNAEAVAKIEVSESIEKNIFDQGEVEDLDLDWEMENTRGEGKNYILTRQEYFEADDDYEQSTLTYFEGDDVLVDEADQPIRDIQRVVGEENIRFGRGSGDPNVVYVRNDGLKQEFEILRSHGKYTEEVLGFIQHDDRPAIRKFRADD